MLRFPDDWVQRKKTGPPISVITAYDFTMARLIDRTEIDAVLVGDSLGMVVQGKTSTVPVTLEEMIYHTSMVRRGTKKFLVADLPFGTTQASVSAGAEAAFRLMKETGADAVKLEGAQDHHVSLIRHLTLHGIPVMGHLGFLPQSIRSIGPYRKQGKDSHEPLLTQAKLLRDAGCFAMVLELVAEDTAQKITDAISIPTIGIASGKQTSGQVQVLHDVLGLDPEFFPKHAMRKLNLAPQIIQAIEDYGKDVSG